MVVSERADVLLFMLFASSRCSSGCGVKVVGMEKQLRHAVGQLWIKELNVWAEETATETKTGKRSDRVVKQFVFRSAKSTQSFFSVWSFNFSFFYFYLSLIHCHFLSHSSPHSNTPVSSSMVKADLDV